MEGKFFLLTLLLLSSSLDFVVSENEPENQSEEQVEESDEEVEVRLSEVDLKDPNQEEDKEVEVVPEGWSVENKLDNAHKFFHGRYYSNTYDHINNELVLKVPSKDREPNMRFAVDWLTQLTKSGKVGFFQVHLVEALRQFTALNATLNKCDREAYAILFKNDKATRGRGHVSPSSSSVLRRIDRMVYLYSLEHAIACLPRYSSIFNSIYSKRNFEDVELFQKATIANHRPQLIRGKFGMNKVDDNNLSLMKKMDSSLICKNNAQAAMEVIKQLAGEHEPNLQFLFKVLDERKGKLVVQKEKVRQLVQKYLVKPCEFFIRELGSNVLQPAKYDIFMMELEDFDHGLPELHNLDFKLGQARYRFCKILVRDQNSLVNSLVKKIGSSSK